MASNTPDLLAVRSRFTKQSSSHAHSSLSFRHTESEEERKVSKLRKKNSYSSDYSKSTTKSTTPTPRRTSANASSTYKVSYSRSKGMITRRFAPMKLSDTVVEQFARLSESFHDTLDDKSENESSDDTESTSSDDSFFIHITSSQENPCEGATLKVPEAMAAELSPPPRFRLPSIVNKVKDIMTITTSASELADKKQAKISVKEKIPRAKSRTFRSRFRHNNRVSVPRQSRFPKLTFKSDSQHSISSEDSWTVTPLTCESSDSVESVVGDLFRKKDSISSTQLRTGKSSLFSMSRREGLGPVGFKGDLVLHKVVEESEEPSIDTITDSRNPLEVELRRVKEALNEEQELGCCGKDILNLYEIVKRKIPVYDCVKKIALDLRMDLKPALQLSKGKRTVAGSASNSLRSQQPQDKSTLDKQSVPADATSSGPRSAAVTSLFSDPDTEISSERPEIPEVRGNYPLQWYNIGEFSLKDHQLRKRFVGIVYPVTAVRRLKGHISPIHCCVFDKKRLFTGSQYIALWDLRSGRYVHELAAAHKGSIRSMQLDSYNDILYSASWDTTIIMWDLSHLSVITILTGHTGVVSCIKLSPQNNILISASYDGTVRVWLTKTYSNIYTVTAHKDNIFSLWFDGNVVCTGSNDTTVFMFTLNTNYTHSKQIRFKTSVSMKDFSTVTEHAKVTGQEWEAPDRYTYMCNRITAVNVMNNLLLGGTSHGELYCWDKRTAHVIAIFNLHHGMITCIHLLHHKLLTAANDGLIKEWEFTTMTCVRTLNSHNQSINHIEISPDQRQMVSVGDDKIVHIWSFDDKIIDKSVIREQTVRILIKHRDHLEKALGEYNRHKQENSEESNREKS